MADDFKCGECKHYAPARNQNTNRPLPSKQGFCEYPVKWPELPKSYDEPFSRNFVGVRVTFPHRYQIWKVNNKFCPVFEKREEKRKKCASLDLLQDQ